METGQRQDTYSQPATRNKLHNILNKAINLTYIISTSLILLVQITSIYLNLKFRIKTRTTIYKIKLKTILTLNRVPPNLRKELIKTYSNKLSEYGKTLQIMEIIKNLSKLKTRQT